MRRRRACSKFILDNKDGGFANKPESTYIYHGKHILESHVGQVEEDGTVDVLYAVLGQGLSVEDDTDEKSDHLKVTKTTNEAEILDLEHC